MAMKTNQNVQLEKLYLKDAARYRALADTGSPQLPIRAWRDKLAKHTQRGIDVFFIVGGGIDLGYVLVLNSLEMPGWGIVHLVSSSPCESALARDVSRDLCRMNPTLYRVDVYCSALRKRQERGDASVRSMDSAEDLSAFSNDLEHCVYYSPELDDRRVAFLPWEFGYIAVATNPQKDKIESIHFVRDRIGTYDLFIRKAAYYAGLVDEEGFVMPNRCHEPSHAEPEILVRARKELTRYLQYAHSPEIEYEFPCGTPFQQSVWKEAAKIPLGSIKTYSDLAYLVEPDREKAGRLARAVGQALGANPLPILIPCHRVIGANRNLVGFSGGVDIKEHLLQMELWKVGLTDEG